jgi:hypothetical protein
MIQTYTRRHQTTAPRWQVDTAYPLTKFADDTANHLNWRNHTKRLETIVGCSFTVSGSCNGMRSISFTFNTKEAAEAAEKKLRDADIEDLDIVMWRDAA